METVKVTTGASQVKASVSGKVTSAQSTSSGDDFMKLLQLKQNQTPAEAADAKKSQTKDSSGKQTDETKDVKDQPVKAKDEDGSDQKVSGKEGSEQDIVLQAALQQAMVQITVLPEAQSGEAVQMAAENVGDAVMAEAAVQIQPEPTELKQEIPVSNQETKAEAGQNTVAKSEEQPAAAQQDTSRVQQLSTDRNHEEQGAAVESRKSRGSEDIGRKVEEDDGRQDQVYGSDSVRGDREASMTEKTEQIPLKTTQSDLPQDLGKTLASRFSNGPQTLTIELEPASLGKLTIKLVYEGGRAAVSILTSNPKTLELLSEKAAEIASILKEKTGQETLIYTQAPEKEQQEPDQNQGGQGNRQGQQDQHQDQQDNQHQTESFAQQLRLGLV